MFDNNIHYLIVSIVTNYSNFFGFINFRYTNFHGFHSYQQPIKFTIYQEVQN